MCGICGTFTKNEKGLTKFELSNFYNLLFQNQERGLDSTGVAILQKSGKIDVLKNVGSAFQFLKANQNEIERLAIGSSAIIGHTRYATTGAVTAENAHPFIFPEVVGIHNGIISNHKKFGAFSVDSQAIFSEISKTKNDFKKVFTEINGNIACAYFYKNRLCLYRRDNPLFLFSDSEEQNFYFSSVDYSLSNSGLTEFFLDFGEYIEFENGELKEYATLETYEKEAVYKNDFLNYEDDYLENERRLVFEDYFKYA